MWRLPNFHAGRTQPRGRVPIDARPANLGLVISGASSTCAAAPVLRCVDATAGGSEWTQFTSLAAGTYWVWVYGKVGARYLLETRFDPQQ